MFFGLCRDESQRDQYDKAWNSRIPQGNMTFWGRSSCQKLMNWNRWDNPKDKTHEKTFRSLKKGSGFHWISRSSFFNNSHCYHIVSIYEIMIICDNKKRLVFFSIFEHIKFWDIPDPQNTIKNVTKSKKTFF